MLYSTLCSPLRQVSSRSTSRSTSTSTKGEPISQQHRARMFLSARRGLLRLNNFAKLPPENPREIAQCFESSSGQYPASSCFFLPQCPVPEIACTLLRSKWAAGKARGGRVSQSIRNRRATPPPAHFHRNPPGRSQLAVFLRCSLDPYHQDMGLRSRLEKTAN
jgi:hypothetical protein